MAKPNFNLAHGGLATSRYDFQSHIDGYAFRHNADEIDIDPAVSIAGTPYITAASAFSAISSFVAQTQANGEGFATVGDGLDCWHNANGTINLDPTVPSLDSVLNPIFNAIITNTPLTGVYARIQRGGIVVIKGGTYYVLNTINVPPGITILGEGYGTKIVNATSLVMPSSPGSPAPPKLVSTAAPVFKILADQNRANNDGAINSITPYFLFGRATRFENLVIGDNFIEPTILGDFTYKLPQNYATNTPLILQEPGSYLECKGVSFIGRVNFSSGQTVGTNGVTSYPIQLDSASPLTTGTILKVSNSFIDGFALAGEFRGTGYDADICEYNNNKIRVYGYLGNNSSLTRNNCVLSTTACNIEFQNNYVVGNGNNVLTGVNIDINGQSPPANKNLMPRVHIVGNSGVVNDTPSFAGTANNLNVNILLTNEATTQTVVLSTVANNTFGSDSSGQRTIVSTIVNLQALDDTSLAAGAIVWVSSVEEHFYLDRGTIANGLTADGVNVITTASTTGKWIRLLYINYGNAQINGNLTVNGTITGTITGSNTITGNLHVTDDINGDGNLNVPNATTTTNNLVVKGLTSLGTTQTSFITPTSGLTYTTTPLVSLTSAGTGRTSIQFMPPNTGTSTAVTIYKNNTTGGIEIADNCFFTGIGGGVSGWSSYDTTKCATLMSVGSTLNTAINGSFVLKTKSPGTATWIDTSWNSSEQFFAWTPGGTTGSGLWEFRQSSVLLAGTNMVDGTGAATQPSYQISGNAGHLNLNASNTANKVGLQNAIYADNITKAWGCFTVDSGGNILGNWFGLANPTPIAFVGPYVTINLAYAFDNVNYAVIPTIDNVNRLGIAPADVIAVTNKTTSSFRLHWMRSSDGSDISMLFLNSMQISFEVKGFIGG